MTYDTRQEWLDDHPDEDLDYIPLDAVPPEATDPASGCGRCGRPALGCCRSCGTRICEVCEETPGTCSTCISREDHQ